MVGHYLRGFNPARGPGERGDIKIVNLGYDLIRCIYLGIGLRSSGNKGDCIPFGCP